MSHIPASEVNRLARQREQLREAQRAGDEAALRPVTPQVEPLDGCAPLGFMVPRSPTLYLPGQVDAFPETVVNTPVDPSQGNLFT